MKRRSLLELLRIRYPERSKQELHAAVMCGEVRVEGETVRDPKRRVRADAGVAIGGGTRYVSRGGDKLEHALQTLGFAVADKVFLDAGASTGGFTDCLLQHGASCVHAVDVGYNQLDYRLRRDPRVVVHERTNISAVDRLDPPADRAVADLSFRSLLGITGTILGLTREKVALVLCKPQFERGVVVPNDPSGARFDGIVRSGDEVVAIVTATIQALEREGVEVCNAAPSVVSGRRGNREVFLLVAAEDACGLEQSARPTAQPTREQLVDRVAAELAGP